MSADVIDIFNNNKIPSTSTESDVKPLLEAVLKGADLIEELAILVKDKVGDETLLYTSGLSVKDKAFFIQMLQHDIFSNLELDDELFVTPDQ